MCDSVTVFDWLNIHGTCDLPAAKYFFIATVINNEL